jgi:hypothetical protein
LCAVLYTYLCVPFFQSWFLSWTSYFWEQKSVANVRSCDFLMDILIWSSRQNCKTNLFSTKETGDWITMKTYIFICRKKASVLFDEQVVGEHSLPLCTKSSHNMHVLVTVYWPATITSHTFNYRVISNPVCIQLFEFLRYVIVDSYVGILFYYVWATFSNLKFHIPSIKLIHFGVTYILD